MTQQFPIALRMTLATLLLTGLGYPLAVTAVAQLAFADRANGSPVTVNRHQVGSALIGQRFEADDYFQGRPSAAGPNGYDATASSGSNDGPTSQKLKARVQSAVERLTKQNPRAPGAVPIELVTASGSGLDPHLSPAAAHWQAPRVAAARGASLDQVAALVEAHVEPRTFDLLGEPRVNLLLLNIALDGRFPRRVPLP